MHMKLFYAAGACSLSPHIVARESGLDLQIEKVDTKSKKTASGADFFAINPKGYVPALQLDDGAVLTEGPAIVQYLGDKAPASGLVPANGTMDRYRLQETLGFINSEIHKNYSPLFDAATPEGTRSAALDKLKKRYALFEKRLEGKPFLFGDKFTVADAYLFTVTNWAGHVGLDLSGLQNLQAFQKRMGDRPAVKEALKAESASK